MLHLPQQRGKRGRHTGDMQQAKQTRKLAGLGLLTLLALLWIAAVLGTARAARGHQQAGLMTEIVCTARRANIVVKEIVIRAPRPDRLVGTVAQLSGIEK
jgi:uncharacterized protein HemX